MAIQIQDLSKLFGIGSSWEVSEITYDSEELTAEIHVIYSEDLVLRCPECGKACPGYDHRRRKWRHTRICDYHTHVVARVPRVQCSEHGIKTVSVPWADARVQFTTGFEARVIDWSEDAGSLSTVATRLKVSWRMISNIMERAVKRGLARREEEKTEHICVDEIAFTKGHNYVTIVGNPKTGHVLHVADERKKESLESYSAKYFAQSSRSPAQLKALKSLSMDMWPAFISATLKWVPDAETKIAFDRFHVARYIGGAVDKVRKQENRELRKEGSLDLTGTKYVWLTNPQNMSVKQKKRFQALKKSSLRTARAWAIKDLSQRLWHYTSRTWARKGWTRWLSWAMRCRLAPMKEAAKTVKKHLWGIINAIVLKVSNGPAESINSRIKSIKVRARGYRNKQRFATAIYFYLGGLDMYPEGYRN